MVEKKDGGAAFPSDHLGGRAGMSLRDYLAAKAMLAMVPVYATQNGGIGVDHLPGNVSILAYRMADAMLEARKA